MKCKKSCFCIHGLNFHIHVASADIHDSGYYICIQIRISCQILLHLLHLLFLLLTVYGGVSAMSFWTNILWVLLACARGWAALALYKGQEETV